ncbi:hypothetical protein C8Q72DRAFT_784086 [Fomitopsis betulina]|nr:hypothetical protein C8Q72DRAFT_784086 [Fomitopsis betulina]
MDSPTREQDIMRIWSLLAEVSEQLTQNRSTSISIHSLTSGARSQAIHSQTGFVLRRFNLDKPKDVYDAELERMNAAMSVENQTLQNDNRQLNTLVREYEQTLENVMTQFRERAYEVQQRELALLREYETAIVQQETETLSAALIANSSRSESLARLGRLLRAVMRKLNGEDFAGCETAMAVEEVTSEPLQDEFQDDGDPDTLQRRVAAAEWSLERESELARLERENEELRMLLRGVVNEETAPAPLPAVLHQPEQEMEDMNEDGRASPALSVPSSTSTIRPGGRRLGGPPGTVGPFGSYKMRTQFTGQ